MKHIYKILLCLFLGIHKPSYTIENVIGLESYKKALQKKETKYNKEKNEKLLYQISSNKEIALPIYIKDMLKLPLLSFEKQIKEKQIKEDDKKEIDTIIQKIKPYLEWIEKTTGIYSWIVSETKKKVTDYIKIKENLEAYATVLLNYGLSNTTNKKTMDTIRENIKKGHTKKELQILWDQEEKIKDLEKKQENQKPQKKPIQEINDLATQTNQETKEKIYTPKTKKPKRGKKKKTVKTEDLFKDLETKEEKTVTLKEKTVTLKEKIDQLDQKTLNEKTIDDILNQINEKQTGEKPAYYNQIAEKIAGLYKDEKSNENKKEIKKLYKKLPKYVQKDVLMPYYIKKFKKTVKEKKINKAIVLQLTNNIEQWDNEEKEEFKDLITQLARKIVNFYEKSQELDTKEKLATHYSQLPKEIRKEVPLTKPKEEKPKPEPKPTKKTKPEVPSRIKLDIRKLLDDLIALWAHL